MMARAEEDDRVMTIVAAALRQPASEREGYARAACGADEEVLREVLDAIDWEERMGGFLQRTIASAPAAPAPGDTIGRYRLLRRIGEGGMAEVWEAEQTTPVRRTVALKLIKPGLETATMVRRFESERQALALMEHPAIAKMFDAGTTDEGRTYFAMEYVAGAPITEYCDQQRLGVKERLDLFLEVCQGVQHAHHKAIIHRDLKPSNILVGVVDGKPTPKIIDFGIAKAAGQPLTDRTITMFTGVGILIGTPEYMSPEQADPTQQNVDTRTDVYSLGLVLYRLLTGAPPFEADGTGPSNLIEILRRIREEDAPRPSTKVRKLREKAAAAVRHRGTEPAVLARELRGDLDVIVMKALEKDRARRYGSPAELAEDIRRYLRDEPVLANPPTVLYRARKFVRRRRLVVSAAAVVALLVAAFATQGILQARRLARERDRANAEARVSRQVTEFLADLFKIADPGEARGNTVTAREILDTGVRRIDNGLQGAPEVQARLLRTMGSVYQRLGLYSVAESVLEHDVEGSRLALGPVHRETLSSIEDLCELYLEDQRPQEAQQRARAALADVQRALGPRHADSFRIENLVGRTLTPLSINAIPFFEGARQRELATLGPAHEVTLEATYRLGYARMMTRGSANLQSAESLFREVLAGRRRVLGPEHDGTISTMYALALDLRFQKRLSDAEQLYREVYDTVRLRYGMDHPDTARALLLLGVTLGEAERRAEAIDLFRWALQIDRKVLGPAHPYTLNASTWLANAYMAEHQFDKAGQLFRSVYEEAKENRGDAHPATLSAAYNLARLAAAQKHREEALRLLAAEVAAGGYRPVAGTADKEFEFLRGDPRFESILRAGVKRGK